MKKEFYEKPQSEIEKFVMADILTASGNPGDDNDTTFPWA